ncbi:oligosaccharide flippase family protein [Puniceibacterium sediminis]|uniref:oligosaccharide flippase family protein n=1 Tax=Puniceibacterium sediminis TaxID=1608407 RepID=UPI001595CFEE|nr:oligosaccharide flippase family protein [Puniceibacterium sediminis]
MKGQALWSVVLQFSRFGGNAVVFLVMARFLTIEQIGAFGMAYAPVRWLQVLHKTGISNSVVVTLRRKEGSAITDDDPAFTALFWLSMAATLLMTVGIVMLALVLGAVQRTDQPVDQMMLVLILVLVAFAVSSVPEGLLRKNMEIRALALRTLAVQFLSAGLAVILAFYGFGGWALVGFAVMNAVLSSVVSIAMAGWLPSGGPDIIQMRAQTPQAAAISGRALLSGSIYAILQFSIGLVLGLGAAGAFQIAQRVYQILDALCLAPIRFLVLPLFSRTAEVGDGTLPGRTIERGLYVTGLVSAPFYIGTIAIAGPALTLVIGAENASHSVLPLQLLCVLGLPMASLTILTQALTVVGHAGLAFHRTVWMLLGTVVFSLPALLISVEAVTLCFVVVSYLVMLLFFRQLEPILGLSGPRAFGAVARPYVACVLAVLPGWGAATYLLANTAIPGWAILLVVPLTVAGGYLGMLRLVAPAALTELRKALKR